MESLALATEVHLSASPGHVEDDLFFTSQIFFIKYIIGPIALNNFVLAFPRSCPRPFPENSFSSQIISQRTIQDRKPQSRSGQPSANTFPFQHQSLGPKAAIAAVINNSCLDKPDSINSFNESLPKMPSSSTRQHSFSFSHKTGCD